MGSVILAFLLTYHAVYTWERIAIKRSVDAPHGFDAWVFCLTLGALFSVVFIAIGKILWGDAA